MVADTAKLGIQTDPDILIASDYCTRIREEISISPLPHKRISARHSRVQYSNLALYYYYE